MGGGGGAYMRGAYMWSNISVKDKLGLFAGGLYVWGGGGAEKYGISITFKGAAKPSQLFFKDCLHFLRLSFFKVIADPLKNDYSNSNLTYVEPFW